MHIYIHIYTYYTHIYTHTYTHTHIYIYIYLYIYSTMVFKHLNYGIKTHNRFMEYQSLYVI